MSHRVGELIDSIDPGLGRVNGEVARSIARGGAGVRRCGWRELGGGKVKGESEGLIKAEVGHEQGIFAKIHTVRMRASLALGVHTFAFMLDQ